jgi:hypothetical protein
VTLLVVSLLLFPAKTKTAPQSPQATKAQTPDVTCHLTLPRKAPVAAKDLFGAAAADWSGDLYVGGLWPNGTVVFKPGGTGFILPDGSMSMKFGWLRAQGLRGRLTIHGKRLDASAPPLRAEIPEGYGDTGFQATGVIFPAEGCWQVTGQVGDTALTFITRAIKITAPN